MSQIAVMTPEQIQDIVLQTIALTLPAAEAKKSERKLLSGKEVEEEYGISERNLERWRYEGVGPQYTTIGRRIYYERDVLDTYIVEGRVKTSGRGD